RRRREQEAEQRRPDAGREPVHARVEVADDVAPVVADEAAQLLALLVLAHPEQAAREIAPALDGAVPPPALQAADLAVRDVVQHVLERRIPARAGLGDLAR